MWRDREGRDKETLNPASVVCNLAEFSRTDEQVFCVCDPADGGASMLGSFTHGRTFFPGLGVLDLFCSLPAGYFCYKNK